LLRKRPDGPSEVVKTILWLTAISFQTNTMRLFVLS